MAGNSKARASISTSAGRLHFRGALHSVPFTIHSLVAFEEVNPAYSKNGAWEEVRKERCEGLLLLASPKNPGDGRAALVVDFREIYSLPFEYLVQHAVSLGSRWRLDSPYLEHFSQAFARFFMRVGLPSAVPPIPN